MPQGRPIPPLSLSRGPTLDCAGEALRAQLLQMLYSIRSERLLRCQRDFSTRSSQIGCKNA